MSRRGRLSRHKPAAVASGQRDTAGTWRSLLVEPALWGLLILLLAAWALAFASLGWPWRQIGTFTDGLAYLWMASAIHGNGSGAQVEHAAVALYAGRFPPLYPAWLALFGAGPEPEGMRAANLAQLLSVLLALGAALLWWWRLFARALPLVLATALLLPLPWLLTWSLELGSEALFAALLLGACLLAAARPFRLQLLAVALVLGLAALTRSHGLVMLAPLAYWLWQEAISRTPSTRAALIVALPRMLWASVCLLLPSLTWALWRRSQMRRGEDSYWRELQRGLEALPGGVGEVLLAQATGLLQGLMPPLGAFEALRLPLAVLLLALAVLGAWRLRQQQPLAAAALPALLLPLLVWPWPEHLERIGGPLSPLLLGCALYMVFGRADSGTDQARGLAAPAQLMSVAALSLLGVLALSQGAGSLCAAHRLAAEHPQLATYVRSAIAQRAEDPRRTLESLQLILDAAAQIDERLPEAACLHALLPDLIALRTRRAVLDLPAGFDWQRVPCDYVFAVRLRAPGRAEAPMYPADGRPLDFKLLFARADAQRRISAALLQRPLLSEESESSP